MTSLLVATKGVIRERSYPPHHRLFLLLALALTLALAKDVLKANVVVFGVPRLAAFLEGVIAVR